MSDSSDNEKPSLDSKINLQEIRLIDKYREKLTFGSSTTQFQKLNPEADLGLVLLHQLTQQNDGVKVSNEDLVGQAFNTQNLDNNDFDPHRFLFLNAVEDPTRQTYTRHTLDELVFKNSGISKSQSSTNSRLQKQLKDLQTLLKKEGKDLPRFDALDTFSVLQILSITLKLFEYVQLLAEDYVDFSQNAEQVIKNIFTDQIDKEPQEVDLSEFSTPLQGTNEYLKKMAFLSTVTENSLDHLLSEKSNKKQQLSETRRLQVRYPLDKKQKAWFETVLETPSRTVIKITEQPKISNFRFKDQSPTPLAQTTKSSVDESGSSGKKRHRHRERRRRRRSRSRSPRSHRSRSRSRRHRSRSRRSSRSQSHLSPSRDRSVSLSHRSRSRDRRSRSDRHSRSDRSRNRHSRRKEQPRPPKPKPFDDQVNKKPGSKNNKGFQ